MLDPSAVRPPPLESLLLAYARNFPIERGKLRVVNMLWRLAAGSAGPRRLARLLQGGFVMPCDLSEMLQRQFYFFGTYYLERDLLETWAGLAAEAQVVLDVGANAGIYSLAALAARPDAVVHAFEPTPEIAAALRRTAALNGLDGLVVHEAAVFDHSGAVALQRFQGESGDNGGMNFVIEDSGGAAERVRSVRLDEFLAAQRLDRVDLMKMDIQGHEPTALRGAGALLREGRIRTLFMELNWADDPSEPCPAEAAVGLLQAAGYQFSPTGRRLAFREAGDWLRSYTDIIARHASALGTA